MPSMLQVSEVSLMVVSLFLEAYMKVCLHMIAVFQPEHSPLYDIPQIEEDEQKLALLCGVDTLVVKVYGT